MASFLDQLIGTPGLMPAAVNALVPATPRRRAAVVAHDGYLAVDTWVKVQPAVFVGGLVGMAVSGMALWGRRRTGPEAWALYVGMFAASATAAWTARPQSPAPVAAGAPAPATPLMAWLDARAAKLDKTEPGWDAAALARIAG
jgi:hypothetical protein